MMGTTKEHIEQQKAARIADIRDILGNLINRAHHKMYVGNESQQIAWARILLAATELELEFADRAKNGR